MSPFQYREKKNYNNNEFLKRTIEESRNADYKIS